MSKNEMIMLPREVAEQAVASIEMLNAGKWTQVTALAATLRAALEQPQDHIEQHLGMVPAGWKLVPIDPTDDMLYDIQEFSHILPPRGKRIWAHMLAAAPQPPALGRPQSNPTPYLYYDPENGDTWTQEAIDEGFFPTDNLIPLYAK